MTVFVTVDVSKRDNDRIDSTPVKFKKFSDIHRTRFRNSLVYYTGKKFLLVCGVITAFEHFYTTLFNTIDECFPICKKK